MTSRTTTKIFTISVDGRAQAHTVPSDTMGIPYSKEINAAFEQVTPLVAAGFEVLQTTKDIAILLAFIQILTVAILAFILLALLALLVTINPDMDKERRELVTPTLIWLVSWVYAYGTPMKWLLRILLLVVSVGFCLFLWHGSLAGVNAPKSDEADSGGTPEEQQSQLDDAKDKGKGKAKDK
ncbi:hypothetical protein LTR47_010523 [Exophiala xenobiotica]|nr:hypothetical protein LTR41_008410 [Exophiala xenobiotica]KAK5216934.1 hypothetical protein LTR72_009929 [Exophiala xenobiotica]KAK5222444.1 hypothetical protein LTR47_010523 [Exophiala xenobiotica]KAK5245505.1 hypothetical protein LTS06_009081 [Exophiala xenobiotica]KAK5287596.1 hypothetical protein LTR14_008826 [Exophiala xenobiotica]